MKWTKLISVSRFVSYQLKIISRLKQITLQLLRPNYTLVLSSHADTHIYVYIYTHICIYVYIYVYINICIYVCIYMQTYICLFIWLNMERVQTPEKILRTLHFLVVWIIFWYTWKFYFYNFYTNVLGSFLVHFLAKICSSLWITVGSYRMMYFVKWFQTRSWRISCSVLPLLMPAGSCSKWKLVCVCVSMKHLVWIQNWFVDWPWNDLLTCQPENLELQTI